MEKVYGNRIPSAYRWTVGLLVAMSLIFLVTVTFSGLVNPLPSVILTIICLVFVIIYWRAGTIVSANSNSVQLQLPPLWRKTIQFEEIRSIAVEPIKPLEREWGNRGSLKRGGEIFIDAGQSTSCLAFYLIDSKVIRIGVSSLKRGQEIANVLESHREKSSTVVN